MPSGYSGTPLAKKLSLKDGTRVWWDGVPKPIRNELLADDLHLDLLDAPGPPVEAAHIFVVSRVDLEEKLAQLRPLLAPSGFVWVSWPKQASGVPTDITENVIRDVALPMGLVDVKVCAVDQTWSGLKLMIGRDRR